MSDSPCHARWPQVGASPKAAGLTSADATCIFSFPLYPAAEALRSALRLGSRMPIRGFHRTGGTGTARL
jgi:hypothetical protein